MKVQRSHIPKKGDIYRNVGVLHWNHRFNSKRNQSKHDVLKYSFSDYLTLPSASPTAIWFESGQTAMHLSSPSNRCIVCKLYTSAPTDDHIIREPSSEHDTIDVFSVFDSKGVWITWSWKHFYSKMYLCLHQNDCNSKISFVKITNRIFKLYLP